MNDARWKYWHEQRKLGRSQVVLTTAFLFALVLFVAQVFGPSIVSTRSNWPVSSVVVDVLVSITLGLLVGWVNWLIHGADYRNDPRSKETVPE